MIPCNEKSPRRFRVARGPLSGPRRARSRLRLDSASQKPTCLALKTEKRRTGHYFFFLAAFFFAGAFFFALLDAFLLTAMSASLCASRRKPVCFRDQLLPQARTPANSPQPHGAGV